MAWSASQELYTKGILTEVLEPIMGCGLSLMAKQHLAT